MNIISSSEQTLLMYSEDIEPQKQCAQQEYEVSYKVAALRASLDMWDIQSKCSILIPHLQHTESLRESPPSTKLHRDTETSDVPILSTWFE